MNHSSEICWTCVRFLIAAWLVGYLMADWTLKVISVELVCISSYQLMGYLVVDWTVAVKSAEPVCISSYQLKGYLMANLTVTVKSAKSVCIPAELISYGRLNCDSEICSTCVHFLIPAELISYGRFLHPLSFPCIFTFLQTSCPSWPSQPTVDTATARYHPFPLPRCVTSESQGLTDKCFLLMHERKGKWGSSHP